MPNPKAKRIITFEDKIVYMTYKQFESLQEAPVQRNHEKRAAEKKHQDKLRHFKEYHRMVFAIQLTDDAYDPTTDITWTAETIFLVDGHTRREFWNKYATEYPDKLIVHIKKVSSIAEVRDAYYSHDAGTNVEKNADLAYGATRSWNTTLNTNLFKVMPITWSSYYTKQDEFPLVTGWKGPDFINGYRLWKQELLFLNSISWTTKYKIPASLTCAALIFLKSHDLSDTSKDIVKRLWTNRYNGPDENDNLDAVTQIIDWIKTADKDSLAHNFNTMPGLVERWCYWMVQAHKEADGGDRLQKYGGRADGSTPTKDDLVKQINSGRLDIAA